MFHSDGADKLGNGTASKIYITHVNVIDTSTGEEATEHTWSFLMAGSPILLGGREQLSNHEKSLGQLTGKPDLTSQGGLWVIGIMLYLRATHTRGFAGHLVLWTFIVLFTALWLLSFNGAPPPSVRVLVTIDLILFPIVFAWAYWIDRLRQPNETSAHV